MVSISCCFRSYVEVCLIVLGFVWYAFVMSVQSMFGICLLFLLDFFPMYIPSQSILPHTQSPPPPGPHGGGSGGGIHGAGAPLRPNGVAGALTVRAYLRGPADDPRPTAAAVALCGSGRHAPPGPMGGPATN